MQLHREVCAALVGELNENNARYPDYTRKLCDKVSTATITEDAWIAYLAVSSASVFSLKINDVECALTDKSSTGVYITAFFGYAKAGDVIKSNAANITAYGLK